MVASYCDIYLGEIDMDLAKAHIEEELSNFKVSYDKGGILTTKAYWDDKVPYVRVELSVLDWSAATLFEEAFSAFEDLLYNIETWAEDKSTEDEDS